MLVKHYWERPVISDAAHHRRHVRFFEPIENHISNGTRAEMRRNWRGKRERGERRRGKAREERGDERRREESRDAHGDQRYIAPACNASYGSRKYELARTRVSGNKFNHKYVNFLAPCIIFSASRFVLRRSRAYRILVIIELPFIRSTVLQNEIVASLK